MDLNGRLIPLSILVPIALVIVLVNIYPYHPTTVAGWGILLLLALPMVLAGEFFGERVLGASFVAKLPSIFRVAYGVVILAATVATLIFARPLMEGHLAKWGT